MLLYIRWRVLNFLYAFDGRSTAAVITIVTGDCRAYHLRISVLDRMRPAVLLLLSTLVLCSLLLVVQGRALDRGASFSAFILPVSCS